MSFFYNVYFELLVPAKKIELNVKKTVIKIEMWWGVLLKHSLATLREPTILAQDEKTCQLSRYVVTLL